MSSRREVGGVMLAFTGFAFLVLSFKGTWHAVYLAATGKPPAPAKQPAKPSSSTTAAQGFPGGAPPSTPLARG